MHILPRIPGTVRDTISPRVEAEIKEKVQHLANMYNCSKSFVINTILAEALGIKVRAHYYDYKKVVRRTKKSA